MIEQDQMRFLKRSGEFDYSRFVMYLAKKTEVGGVLSPKCFRETMIHGNTERSDFGVYRLRQYFDLHLCNKNGFKRKRSQHGGYEYLKIS